MLIRLSMIDAFLDAGFQVFEADRAEEAILVLQEHASTIDVLFTDVNMPGASDGVGLAQHVRQNWPWIGLLVTSGRTTQCPAEMPPDSQFIPKPYHPVDAIEQMRALAFAAERTQARGRIGQPVA